MKDLPKVFINNIDKVINNSMERIEVKENSVSLDNILSKDKYSFNHIYNIRLNNNKVIKDSIIQILENKVLTIDNSWINIKDIKSIEEIKK